MPLVFTAPMKKRLTPRARQMLEKSLVFFPELDGKTITVGHTRGSLGVAFVALESGTPASMGIRLRVRNLVYNTIGHELTHLVQGMCQPGRRREPRETTRIPSGEKQCDVWTLARSDLFCDDAPTYLRLPREIRENWPRYAPTVRSLCIAAIEKRRTYRFYLRWLEEEIRLLARREKAKARRSQTVQCAQPIQGWLPLAGI